MKLADQDVEDDQRASLHGWSQQGLLLVRHHTETKQAMLSVFDRQGTCVQSVPVPDSTMGPACQATWLPSEEATVLLHGASEMAENPDLWVWRVPSSVLQHVCLPHGLFFVTCSPCEASALCLSGYQEVSLVSLATGAVVHQMPEGMFGGVWAVWGHLGIAVTCKSAVPREERLVLFTVQEARLTPLHSISIGQLFDSWLSLSCTSPDGAFVLACMFTSQGNLKPRLMLLDFATGGVTQHTVSFMPHKARFSPAGDVVLASDEFGTHHQLLDFR